MKFNEWKYLMLEKLSIEKLGRMGNEVKDHLKDKFENLYIIPDFLTFERSYEPVQQSVLFATETSGKVNSFSFNYDTKGKLYSVDFWAPDKLTAEPSKTLYVESGSLKDVCLLVPEILKNPLKRIDPVATLNGLKRALNERDDLFDASYDNSKPRKSTDKGEKDDHEYDFSDPETIFQDLETYLDLVINGSQPSLLITGSPGVGKTHIVTKMLERNKLQVGKDYVHVKGKSTAAGMYITLYENNGKILVFDDCDSVFQSAEGVNVLKGALDSYGKRSISWVSAKQIKSPGGQAIPNSFDFTGKIIFISNLPQKKIDDAIKSRSFVIEVALSPEDMIKKMRNDVKDILPEMPLFVKELALDLIEDISKKNKNLEINMRTLIKSVKILRRVDDIGVAERLITQQCTYK